MEASEVSEALIFALTRNRIVTVHDIIVQPTNLDIQRLLHHAEGLLVKNPAVYSS